MTLSLFWSRYTLELREQHLRDVDELYHYLIARERWNWSWPRSGTGQIQILRGHNHGEDSWTCRKWLDHMLDWIKENKPPAVYDAVIDKIHMIEDKPIEELEKTGCPQHFAGRVGKTPACRLFSMYRAPNKVK